MTQPVRFTALPTEVALESIHSDLGREILFRFAKTLEDCAKLHEIARAADDSPFASC